MDLNFHQTFKPEKAYISEVLCVSDEVKGLSIEQISSLTGIPQGKSSGKLIPHLKYAKYMGLIDYSSVNGLYSVEPTKLGQAIRNEDSSFSEKISLLALHSNIIKNTTGADLWSFCFYDFYTKYGKDSKYEYFVSEVERKYGKVKLGPFLKSYEEFFSPLNLLEIDQDENTIHFNSFSYNREYYPIIAYIFFDLWDQTFHNETEITSIQLEDMHFRNRFAWSKLEEANAIDCLNDYGVIRLNRQLSPYTIIRLTTTEELLNKLYSELI